MNKFTARFGSLLASATLLGLLGLTGQALAANEKPIRLTMSTQYMDRHPIVQKAWLPWIAEIKKRTNGRVIITYYNPNTLCPDTELFEAVLKGQVDIGDHITSRNPGRLPLNTVTNKIPMITSTAMSGSLAYWELFHTVPALQEEFKGIKIMGLHTTSALQVHTKDKAVTSLNDLKGKRIIGASKDTILAITGLGLNGLMQPSPDIYLAMSRNMGDATFYPVPPMRSFKINEATKYTTYMDGYTGACWFGMNQTKWDSLPADIQKILEETTGEVMTKAIAMALDEGEKEDIEIMRKSGHEFSDLSADEKKRWGDILTPVMKAAWLEEVADTGYPDTEALFSTSLEVLKKYEAQYGRAAANTPNP